MKYMVVASVMVLAACGSSAVKPTEPSPSPSAHIIGALNPAVTQRTIHSTICVAGWTSKIRPSSYYTNALKKKQLPAGAKLSAYEEDHLMPLTLGGAPRDERNLRPIPIKRAKQDDVWEVRLNKQVCKGTLTLAAAQLQMSKIKDGE